jgi:ABC-type multidrug transport system fused ATPase/permease subunit
MTSNSVNVTQFEISLNEGLRWLVTDFFSPRRRWQGVGVFALMLLGGVAELFTLAAVFPLLALMADPKGVPHSRSTEVLRTVGLNVTDFSLPLLGALFCVIAVVAAAIRIALARSSQKFVFRIGYELGVSLYERMLYQPYSFHAQLNSSRIVASVNNVQRLLTNMFMPLMQGLSALTLGSFIVAGLLIVNPSVALAAMLGFSSIYLAVSFATRGRLRRNADYIHAMRKQRIQAVQEGLGGIRDVLIDNSQPVYIKKFARLDKTLRDAQAANALIAVAPRFVVEALGMVFIVGLALFLNAVHGSLAGSLPVLAVLALGAQRLMPLLQQVYSTWANVMGNRAMFLGAVELLRRPVPERFEAEGTIDPLPMNNSLTLDRVSFRYSPDGPDVLQDINVDIPHGSWVGFVGKSGSGKSTMMDLVLGLLKPTTGSILVDGVRLDEANVLSWQKQIAHVSQHIFLSDGTITENVAFGVAARRIDEQRVRDACREAELDELIESLPDGYDTIIGERGVRLSGGQRQRIGIARALYKQASVLVLDEATSALDDLTEASIIDAVQRLGRRYTVLMIAHRLTTLRDCDMIYRMDQGRIVEQGTYGSVIGHGGLSRLAAQV